jgi:Fe-S cluster assembly scaffold protein SufB
LGASLAKIDFEKIRYFIKDTDVEKKTWAEVPDEIKETLIVWECPKQKKNFWLE